ncbi:MAG: alpha/beta hydrolase, partial [Proteiniphilum sp.]
MKRIACLLALFISISLFAGERVTIWPKDKMPHRQNHQIAAMTDESGEKDFNADKNRIAYLEWYDAPAKQVRNGGCMILISGGGYYSCCDVDLIKLWNKTFTQLGFQCVNF